MPGFIGVPELLLFGLVVLLVFGPKRLPEMGRSLGRGMKEFKESVTGDGRKDEVEDEPAVKNVAVEVAAPEIVVVPEEDVVVTGREKAA